MPCYSALFRGISRVTAAIAVVATAVAATVARIFRNRPRRADNSDRTPLTAAPGQPTPEQTKQAAAAFSAICGVKILTEEDAKKEQKKGNIVIKEVSIAEIFYNPAAIKNKSLNKQDTLFYVPDSAYDPNFNCDFTNRSDDGATCERGDYSYERPYGWERKGLSVLGKYKNDTWLGEIGWRSESSSREWPVSYHGTKIQSAENIIKHGYDLRKCERKLHGNGIYSTPSLKVAEGYATNFVYEGEEYKCILQNRVNLNNKKKVKVISKEETRAGAPYFVVENTKDIRPYGLCLKKNITRGKRTILKRR